MIWQVVKSRDFDDYAILIRKGNEGFMWVEIDHVSARQFTRGAT